MNNQLDDNYDLPDDVGEGSGEKSKTNLPWKITIGLVVLIVGGGIVYYIVRPTTTDENLDTRALASDSSLFKDPAAVGAPAANGELPALVPGQNPTAAVQPTMPEVPNQNIAVLNNGSNGSGAAAGGGAGTASGVGGRINPNLGMGSGLASGNGGVGVGVVGSSPAQSASPSSSPTPSLNGAPGMAAAPQGSVVTPAPAAVNPPPPPPVLLTDRPKAKPQPQPQPKPQTVEPVKPKPLPSLTAKSWRIQLVALSSRERAEEEWVKLQSTFRVLAHLRHRIESTENATTQTNLYRLQAGPFKDEVAARNACQTLKQVSQACTVVIPQL